LLVRNTRPSADCSFEAVTNDAECSFEAVTNAADCSFEAVTNAAECSFEAVTNAAECSFEAVTNVAECSFEAVTKAAECSFEAVTNACADSSLLPYPKLQFVCIAVNGVRFVLRPGSKSTAFEPGRHISRDRATASKSYLMKFSPGLRQVETLERTHEVWSYPEEFCPLCCSLV
jgi:hypothetical protein